MPPTTDALSELRPLSNFSKEKLRVDVSELDHALSKQCLTACSGAFDNHTRQRFLTSLPRLCVRTRRRTIAIVQRTSMRLNQHYGFQALVWSRRAYAATGEPTVVQTLEMPAALKGSARCSRLMSSERLQPFSQLRSHLCALPEQPLAVYLIQEPEKVAHKKL